MHYAVTCAPVGRARLREQAFRYNERKDKDGDSGTLWEHSQWRYRQTLDVQGTDREGGERTHRRDGLKLRRGQRKGAERNGL